MYMTNKAILKETEQIVKVHAPLILKELGLEENDGILDRIYVSAEREASTPHGICESKMRKTSMFDNGSYEVGSASITIYPLTFLQYMNKKGKIKQAPFFFRFLKPIIRRVIVFTLAHELRHYWQYVTGEYYDKELMFMGSSILPYELRWCEKDANTFGKQYKYKYVKEVK